MAVIEGEASDRRVRLFGSVSTTEASVSFNHGAFF